MKKPKRKQQQAVSMNVEDIANLVMPNDLDINMRAGTGSADNNGAQVILSGGKGGATADNAGRGGDATLMGGEPGILGENYGSPGDAYLIGGQSGPETDGGKAVVRGSRGGSSSGSGGAVAILAGNAAPEGAYGNGGDCIIRPGSGVGLGRRGVLILDNIPSADPHIPDSVYWNNGVLTRSSG